MNKKTLFQALQKVKEELMLLGFISLLLTVLQGAIQKICIRPSWNRHMLPCEKEDASAVSHFQSSFSGGVLGGNRRLLAAGGGSDYCTSKGKVPLLSLSALHDLHIFIFVLAVVHVFSSALTMVLGGAKIRQWKHWEDAIQKEKEKAALTDAEAPMIQLVKQNEFIRNRFNSEQDSAVLSWLESFCKQFYGSVTRSDYTTMRLGFIMMHCRGNPQFNFYKYMKRALEADFKKVVGISWYLWIFVVFFLLINMDGWETYFWMAFIPLLLLLAVGAKLEHVITELAQEVAEKHSVVEGDIVVKPSDEHFWFSRPKIVLYFIHFILFQNAFGIAFFFFVLVKYGYKSCIMGKTSLVIPKLLIGVIIQILCSYSTLPLYAIVTQMGSSFKKAVFDDHVREGLVGWADKARRRNAVREDGSPAVVQMQNLGGANQRGG